MHHAAEPVGRWYSRKVRFTERQLQAFERDGKVCPISGLPTVVTVGHSRTYFRACDHLIPEKFCRTFIKGADPHILENLLVVHPSIHGRKTKAERFLYAGNLLSFKQEMLKIGYDWAIFERALTALNQSAKERNSKHGMDTSTTRNR